MEVFRVGFIEVTSGERGLGQRGQFGSEGIGGGLGACTGAAEEHAGESWDLEHGPGEGAHQHEEGGQQGEPMAERIVAIDSVIEETDDHVEPDEGEAGGDGAIHGKNDQTIDPAPELTAEIACQVKGNDQGTEQGEDAVGDKAEGIDGEHDEVGKGHVDHDLEVDEDVDDIPGNGLVGSVNGFFHAVEKVVEDGAVEGAGDSAGKGVGKLMKVDVGSGKRHGVVVEHEGTDGEVNEEQEEVADREVDGTEPDDHVGELPAGRHRDQREDSDEVELDITDVDQSADIGGDELVGLI